MSVIFPPDYRPLLLPETMELAFNTVHAAGQRRLEASHLRHVAPPVIVKATGAPGEVSFGCNGVGFRLALPEDLSHWKAEKMKAYGIGAGYGLYTYTIRIDTDLAPDNINGPVCDRWDCIRSIEPEDSTPTSLAAAAERIYAIVLEIEKAVCGQFPHIKPSLPSAINIVHGEAALHTVRDNKAVAIIPDSGTSADIYLWNDVTGQELHIAELSISADALSGWISPAMIAMKVLHLCSVTEIFPMP